MRGKAGFAFVLLGVFSIILAGILTVVDWIGTDDELYRELQMKAGILDAAGISEEDLGLLDGALADCLKGNENALEPLEVEVFGQVQPAFNERERIHMEDCRQLFILLRQARDAAGIAGPILLILGALLLHDRGRIRRAAWIAPLVLLIPLGAFAIWAAADFGAAFNFFHKLLFTNDLWLLDPRTDLLIRLCPASMFMSMGMRIGILSLTAMLAAPAAVSICTSESKERA